MKTIFVLLRKDLLLFFHNKTGVFLTFFVPIALIFIFGQVFGVNRKDKGPSGIPFAVVVQATNLINKTLVEALAAEKSFLVVTQFDNPDGTRRMLEESDLRPLMRENRFHYALIVPPDVVSEDRLGLRLKVLSDPRNEIESQTVNGLLQKVIFSNSPQLIGSSLMGRAQSYLGQARFDTFNDAIAQAVSANFGLEKSNVITAIESGDFGLGQSLKGTNSSSSAGLLSKIVNVETEQVVGAELKNPAATRVVGGWAIMFLLFALSASAASFFEEKNAGLFQRLMSAPVRASQILWSRFLFGVLIGMLQLTALFWAGQVLFQIDVVNHIGNLLVVSAATAAACTAFGMLIAALARTPQAANGLATFLVLTMSATGGAWFPVSFMPEFMQHFARLTLVYWAMEAFSQVLWAGDGFLQILPIVGILLGIAAGVMAIAIWRFNRRGMFE